MSGLSEHAHRSTRARECAPALLPETIAPLEEYIRPRDILDVPQIVADIARDFNLDSFQETLATIYASGRYPVTPEPFTPPTIFDLHPRDMADAANIAALAAMPGASDLLEHGAHLKGSIYAASCRFCTGAS